MDFILSSLPDFWLCIHYSYAIIYSIDYDNRLEFEYGNSICTTVLILLVLQKNNISYPINILFS